MLKDTRKIQMLRTEAEAACDDVTVRLCERALDNDTEARAEALEMIDEGIYLLPVRYGAQ